MENGFVNVLFLKSICNHLEIVNLDQEENKDNSEQLHEWQHCFQDDCIFKPIELLDLSDCLKTI